MSDKEQKDYRGPGWLHRALELRAKDRATRRGGFFDFCSVLFDTVDATGRPRRRNVGPRPADEEELPQSMIEDNERRAAARRLAERRAREEAEGRR